MVLAAVIAIVGSLLGDPVTWIERALVVLVAAALESRSEHWQLPLAGELDSALAAIEHAPSCRDEMTKRVDTEEAKETWT